MVLKRANIVLFFFFLNVIVSMTSDYFPAGMVHIGVIRAVLMLITIPLLMIDGIRLSWTGGLILVCLVYLAILSPFSSAPLQTVDVLLKVAISLLMFLLAYNYIRGSEARRKLARLVPVCLALFIVNFVIAQVFDIGVNPYFAEGFSAGGGGVQQTYLIAYLLLFLPILGFYRNTPFRMKWWEISLMLLALFPLALIGRRGAILGFVIGLAIYLVLTPRKGRLVGLGAAAVVLAVVTMPLYIDHVRGVMEHRMEDAESPTEIGRFQELVIGTKMVRDRGIAHALFGTELYNYTALTNDTRELHTDYATYLIGSGLVGFFFYFSILPVLWLDFWRRIRVLRDAAVIREFAAVLLGLIAAYLIISFSGQYYIVSSLSIIFALWGSMLAYMEELGTQEGMQDVRA